MPITGFVLGCLLVGQTPPATFSAPPSRSLQAGREARPSATLEPIARTETTGIQDAAQAPTKQTRIRPPEMVAAAIQLPAGSTVTGQPITLLSVLGSTSDRRLQLELTRTYWRLVQSVAEYHFCFDYVQQLGSMRASDDELRLARASAAAMLRRYEIETLGVQCELAKLLRLPSDAALPLPADRPHVGAYRTNFQELFAGRTAPEPTALIERVLPVRRQAVDEQGAAVQAAEDALAAVSEQQPIGRSSAATMLQCSRELLRQQCSFIRVVCDYNRNIAEYGLAVAGPVTSPQTLVAMLIGSSQPSTPVASSGVQPATAVVPATNSPVRSPVRNQPTPAASRPGGWKTTDATATPLRSESTVRNEPTLAPPRETAVRNEPTLAPPRDELRQVNNESPTLAPPREAAVRNEPTLAPPRDELKRVNNEEPAVAPSRNKLRPLGKNEPTLAPPRDEFKQRKQITPPASNLEDKPLVPVETPSVSPSASTRTANKPVVETAAAVSPLYPALADAAPAARAKQLTAVLHWDRSLPEAVGKPLSLADCLVRDPGTDRRATIEAYWVVRQRAAEYQVRAQQVELLEALIPMVLERRKDPLGATDMLRARAAQLAAQASLREAHAALIESQYALALRIGATGEAAWPLASTIPHSGSYLLKVDSQPKALAESWPVRRLTAVIQSQSLSIQQSAAVVVEADAVRTAAAEQYRAGNGSIDAAIEGVSAQTQETLTLLQVLTDYNRAIADYVITVLPPSIPATRLVAALVVKP